MIKKFHLKFRSKGYSFFMEIIFLLVNNYKLSQIPITFSDRKKGTLKYLDLNYLELCIM